MANLKDLLPRFSDVTSLMAELERILAGGDEEIVLPQDFLDSVTKLSEEKFSTWEWNYGHSKKTDITRSAKFPCGTVEASISLDEGIITALAFGGDFLGNRPSEEIAALLVGRRFERKDIAAVLACADVAGHFDSMSSEELAHLLLG